MIRDLCRHPDGRVAISKFWTNIAYLAATWIVIKMTLMDRMTFEILLVYLGVVGSADVAKKLIELKYGVGAAPKPPDPKLEKPL